MYKLIHRGIYASFTCRLFCTFFIECLKYEISRFLDATADKKNDLMNFRCNFFILLFFSDNKNLLSLYSVLF